MPLSDEAPSNLSQQAKESEAVHEDEEGWVSDQSSPEETQAKVQSHTEKRACTGRGSKKRRADIHRPSIHHPRVPLPAQIDTSVSTGSNTATPTAPSAPPIMSTSAAPSPESPPPNTSPSDTIDDEPRGRQPPASASSTFSARRKPRQHMRIVSLRGAGSEASSREVSPVRSIRWADAGAGSAPATARWPQSQSAQGSRAPSPSPVESAENDTG